MALGVLEDETWQQAMVEISPGETLVLYSDGITEAVDERGEMLGRQRWIDLAQKGLRPTARDSQDALLSLVHTFAGAAPQPDDITLVVVSREPTPGSSRSQVDAGTRQPTSIDRERGERVE
jgi:sigma-B regulation protein RsbU (phosphoserine phosphatase)